MTASARFLTAALALGLAFTTAACDSTAPDGDDQEFITQVRVTFTNAANPADVVTITATDADGDGAGITFSPASAALRAGATYNAAITLDDTINNESITEEVREEEDEHLFAYSFAPATFGTVTITDTERTYGGTRDLPVGLTFRAAISASATGSGTMRAILFHFDNPAEKTSATSTSDERDIDIQFPVTIAPRV